MKFSRYLCLCIACAAFTLAFNAPPAVAFTLQEAEKETEKLLARLASKEFDGLADQMEAHELFGTANPGLWEQVVTTVSKAYTLFGEDVPVYGFKKLGQKNLGDTLLSNRYAILNGKQPLLFEFWFYKPNKEWQYLTISMVFGSNIQPVLKQWFEGAD